MIWTAEFTATARKQLKKLDRKEAKRLLSYLQEKVLSKKNPRSEGKALAGNLSGLWSYRVGDYRLIAQINEDKVLILVLCVGHRKEVYKKL